MKRNTIHEIEDKMLVANFFTTVETVVSLLRLEKLGYWRHLFLNLCHFS